MADEDIYLSLIDAVRGGRLKAAEELIDVYGLSHCKEWSDGYTLICDALKYGKIEVAKLLLRRGAPVTCKNPCSTTPLHLAAKIGDVEIVEMILDRGANNSTTSSNKQEEVVELLIDKANVNVQDDRGKVPIFYAIENDDVRTTKLLLSRKAKVKGDADLLHYAVRGKKLEIVKALLQHDVDINAVDKSGATALHYAVRGKKLEIVEALLQHDVDINAVNKSGAAALHFATYALDAGEESVFFLFDPIKEPEEDDTEKIVALLLTKGANVNAKTSSGCTPLFTAINFGYIKVVEKLLENNATVNTVAKHDLTPLHVCANRGYAEVCTMLLKKGAIVSAQHSWGYTAVHIAALTGSYKVVEELLKTGCAYKNKYGITPLMIAVYHGHQKTAQNILKYGSEINSKDESGRTALHVASEEGRSIFVETLLRYGADVNIISESEGGTAPSIVRTRLRAFNQPCRSDSDEEERKFEETAYILEKHIIKMRAANLYVCEQSICSLYGSKDYGRISHTNRHILQCEEEVKDLKREKITDTDVSFYDILTKSNNSLAKYMENENIVSILKSGDYKEKFPIYADMIQLRYENGVKREKLLREGNSCFEYLFIHIDLCPRLPLDCTETICGYMSDADLKIFINSCESLGVSTSM